MNTRTKQPQNTEPAPYSVRSTNGLLLWLSGVHFEGHGDFYGLDSALAISTGKADIEAARVVFDHVLLNLQWVIQHPTRRPANIYYKTEDDRFVHAPDPRNLVVAPSWHPACLARIATAHPACPRCNKHHARIETSTVAQTTVEGAIHCEECSFYASLADWRRRSVRGEALGQTASEIIQSISRTATQSQQRGGHL